jgi:hypothetical protein
VGGARSDGEEYRRDLLGESDATGRHIRRRAFRIIGWGRKEGVTHVCTIVCTCTDKKRAVESLNYRHSNFSVTDTLSRSITVVALNKGHLSLSGYSELLPLPTPSPFHTCQPLTPYTHHTHNSPPHPHTPLNLAPPPPLSRKTNRSSLPFHLTPTHLICDSLSPSQGVESGAQHCCWGDQDHQKTWR